MWSGKLDAALESLNHQRDAPSYTCCSLFLFCPSLYEALPLSDEIVPHK